jgi:hypothetical protein
MVSMPRLFFSRGIRPKVYFAVMILYITVVSQYTQYMVYAAQENVLIF